MSVLEFSLYYLIAMQLEQVNANQKQIAINIIDGLGLVLKSWKTDLGSSKINRS